MLNQKNFLEIKGLSRHTTKLFTGDWSEHNIIYIVDIIIKLFCRLEIKRISMDTIYVRFKNTRTTIYICFKSIQASNYITFLGGCNLRIVPLVAYIVTKKKGRIRLWIKNIYLIWHRYTVWWTRLEYTSGW